MKNIKIHTGQILSRTHQEIIAPLDRDLMSAFHTLIEGKGAGAAFTGWLTLPENIDNVTLDLISATAVKLRVQSEVVVVVGIGGSYLGARAIIDALGTHFQHLDPVGNFPHLLFAGHHLSASYHKDLLKLLDKRSYSVIVISKSGTTTEPALAFRLLKQHLIAKYGKTGAVSRIIAITDQNKGALRSMANAEGYSTFIVPDDVGGRYSVLTPVGLVPLAVAGIPVHEILQGAADMRKEILKDPSGNPASCYAKARVAMYLSGKPIEIMVHYEPRLTLLAEWWKQLFGESEGKNGKGILPAAVSNTTDLHSMGQYIQDGLRILFETVLSIEKEASKTTIPFDNENLDGLNYLANRDLTEVNQIAEEATRQAHVAGGVPNIRIVIPKLTPYYIGQLIYMFEFACALSAYMLSVNPFDQPGVEAYKINMFKLLGKPTAQ